MATPAKVIDQQHEEARQLLSVMEYAEPPSSDEIPLSMKTCPTMPLFGDDNDGNGSEEKKAPMETEKDIPSITSWSSRGRVDISKLQNLVREGYCIAEHTSTKTAAGGAKKTTTSKATKGSPAEKNNTNNNKTSKTPPFQKYTAADVRSKTNLWDPINASVNNVNIVRPSHDAWGIGKIVLLFADDFLKDVYEMPWWHLRADLKEAVQPILEALQISQTQVVRLLLASLPPQTTIPLHQDSGAWVKETHRVHVPIIVEHVNQVMFRVGLTDSQLQRIDCTPGHVFEMNNQCRHAVSNCSDDYRVHLILDYRDAHDKTHKPRIPLQSGERLLQTRRSVDRLIDRGSRPTPSFLILGAQKAGTTSLYEYMMQHPLIVRPKRRETHCLDWRWKGELEPNGEKNWTEEELRNHCHLFYETAALKLHPSCCTGDSTPSYLLDSRRVIPNLKRAFDWKIQFLVLTRNPIQRAESHFAMVTSPEGSPAQLKTRGLEWRNKSFEQVVKEEMQQMHQCGLIPYWNTETGSCDRGHFDNFTNTAEEDQAWDLYLERFVKLNTGSYGLLARGLYALNLRPWLKAFDQDQFLVLSLEDDLNSDRVRGTMERVFDHIGVPSSYELADVSPQNARAYEPKMNDELYGTLQRFFEPHNQRWLRVVQALPSLTYHQIVEGVTSQPTAATTLPTSGVVRS